MPAELIDGAAIAREVRADVARDTARLAARGIRPGLAVVLVGDNPASAVYVRAKGKASEEAGMHSETIRLPTDISQAALVDHIDRLNADPAIHGILVQMPLPAQIRPDAIVRRVRPEKDVDGFHPVNVGKLLIGERDGFAPCTPAGIQELLRRSGVDTKGKDCVIVGRSTIVGKPMAALLMQDAPGANATVTVCHSRTIDLAAHTRRADILIVAAGRPRYIGAAMVKPGAVVIDVGINRVEDARAKQGYIIVGDVDLAAVRDVAALITPVPGGVGPMTIAMLLKNTVRAAELAAERAERDGGGGGWHGGGRRMRSSATTAWRATLDEPVPGASPASAVAVSTLTQTARGVIEGAFHPLWVRGEVTDFKAHRNGHWYFGLRDDQAQLRCVIWSRDQRAIPAPPDDGMQVVAFGQVSVYPARGDVQLMVVALEAEGDGLYRKALERTLRTLEREGLLAPERKRPLPTRPRRIAVITSPSGAAIHDIAAVVQRRAPGVQVVLVPARVQGEGAVEELCAALDRVARWRGADLVIIGRGGGAKEDLRAFNDERVARALAACPHRRFPRWAMRSISRSATWSRTSGRPHHPLRRSAPCRRWPTMPGAYERWPSSCAPRRRAGSGWLATRSPVPRGTRGPALRSSVVAAASKCRPRRGACRR